MDESNEDLRDVYICYDDQLCDRVVEVLEEAGIDAMLRDRSSSAFPLNVGNAGQRIVAVPDHQMGAARTCIEGAIEDGVLTNDGTLINP